MLKAGVGTKPKKLSRSCCYTCLTLATGLWGNMVSWCSRRHYFGQVPGVSLGFSIEPDSRARSSIACALRTARPQQPPACPHCTPQLPAKAQLGQRQVPGWCVSPVLAASTGELRGSTHSSLSTDWRRLHVPVLGLSVLPYLFSPVCF